MPSCPSLGAFALIVGGLTFSASSARAADEPSAKPVEKPAVETDASIKAPPPATADAHGALEEEHKAARFIGLRFREVVVPKFMVNIFADGGATVSVPMIGPEFGIRKDHLETDFAIMYADYSMKPFLFKGKSDGDESYEIVSSSMKLLYLTVDLLYDVPIDSSGHFSFLFGGGVGIAPVFGSLYRAQAYPTKGNTGDPNDVSQWTPCKGAGAPNKTTKMGNAYCDDANTHFGNPASRTGYAEPSWANGGSKPIIFPWIALPQLSFRYKPIKELQTRADFGFSITGFFLGLSAGYGL